MTAIAGARDMGELVALTPYLLGYHPEPGLVLVGMIDRRVGPVLRLELTPADLVGVPLVDEGLEPALVQMGRCCDHAFLLAFEHWAGQSDAMAGLIRCRAALAGLDLDETVRVLDGRWCWVVDGVQEGGGPVPDPDRVPGAAEFVIRGRAPLRSRAELAGLIAGRAGDHEQVATWLTRARRSSLLTQTVTARGPSITDLGAAFAAWRQVIGLDDAPSPRVSQLAAHTVATAVRALDDIEVRDELYGWISPRLGAGSALPARVRGLARTHLGPRSGIDDTHLQRRLVLLVQHTPEPDRTPVLTALALCCWGVGDGALAREAAVAALAIRPDYTMAQLVFSAIRHAVCPHGARDDDALAR